MDQSTKELQRLETLHPFTSEWFGIGSACYSISTFVMDWVRNYTEKQKENQM